MLRINVVALLMLLYSCAHKNEVYSEYFCGNNYKDWLLIDSSRIEKSTVKYRFYKAGEWKPFIKYVNSDTFTVYIVDDLVLEDKWKYNKDSFYLGGLWYSVNYIDSNSFGLSNKKYNRNMKFKSLKRQD